MKKKRRKIRYGRLAFCILVLVGLAVLICFAAKGCISLLRNDEKTDTKPKSQTSDEYSQQDIQAERIPVETEYCFDYEDITFTEEIDAAAYDCVLKNNEDIGKGNLILVNNDYQFAFTGTEEADYLQLNLHSDDTYYVKDNTVLVNEILIEPLNEMLDDFYAVKGRQINVISGYRSFEYQMQLYAEDLELTGLDYSTLVALPGSSEHHTGLALDFGILNNGEYYSYDGIGDESWINENCHNYGFILRYLENKEDLTHIQYESWHFRYIGEVHAFIVNYYNMCFEEYINMLRAYEFGKRHLGIRTPNGDYEVYYVPSGVEQTEVFVPKNREYEISGNNVDGFIVTVALS
ncbi:MAG: M15 family metallopeptidase [Oscillospiraceae bacterium]|nr:M15 family metallopeptidase [Oscillospiraceae bacterium]